MLQDRIFNQTDFERWIGLRHIAGAAEKPRHQNACRRDRIRNAIAEHANGIEGGRKRHHAEARPRARARLEGRDAAVSRGPAHRARRLGAET
jgi:hypothetical protein